MKKFFLIICLIIGALLNANAKAVNYHRPTIDDIVELPEDVEYAQYVYTCPVCQRVDTTDCFKSPSTGDYYVHTKFTNNAKIETGYIKHPNVCELCRVKYDIVMMILLITIGVFMIIAFLGICDGVLDILGYDVEDVYENICEWFKEKYKSLNTKRGYKKTYF